MSESGQENAKAQKKELKKHKKREKKLKKWEKQKRLLFPADKKGRHMIRSQNFVASILHPFHAFLYPYKRYGNKKVGVGAYIFVGNHYSDFDIFFPKYATREGIHFIAKQSILEAPVLGYLGRKWGTLGAMRDGSDVRLMIDAMKILKNGEKIAMYPEGTRNKVSDEEFLPFHGGAAMLAIKTKTPIIPVVICNRPRLFRRTHVVYGEPVELSEYYDRKLTPDDYAEADEKLKNIMYDIRARHRAMLASKKKKGKSECKSS
ncbi:MAG: 1-acyl-sn-glycerol-3-phosphate acyltransferase [Clostridia bacterium]|nr:1-acyl-sn-glycerol-3-phosphate acyltransferase [Clostridia bacterium]